MVRLRVWALAALLLAALLAFAPRGLAAPAPPAPTAGKTVVVARVSGLVKVRLPGEPGFNALHGARVVPLRTIVDALRGVVRLTSADGSGLFYQGVFQVFEPKVAPAGAGKGRITDLHLVGGDFSVCSRKLAGRSAPAKPIRSLWGNAKGRFRTKGRYAAATVRGTVWLTADFCTGSEVTVRTGVVGVRDLVRDQTVIVPAGKKYDAEVNVAPVNSAPPAIAGTPTIGQTLTATAGTWTGTPAPTFAYQWRRCDAAGSGCVDIAGATGTTYVVQPADAGATLRVRVSATNAAGTASATSPASGVVATAPANVTPPSITGTVAVGSPLAGSVGAWSGVPVPTFAFQWQRCDFQGNGCMAIAGATSATYTIQAADVGSTLRVQVVATNAAGTASAVSARSPIVASAPANTTSPSIGGTLVQGSSVTASVGTWSGVPAPTFAVQWERCDSQGNGCAPIAGETTTTYTIQAADVGSTLRVQVVATNIAGTASATSPVTAVVASAPANTSPPSISGTVALGSSLTASLGTWSGVPAPTLAVQWQRCDPQGNGCAPIAGETTTTYTIQAADVGSTLRVQVVATNSAGSASAVSAPVGQVVPGISIADVSMFEGSPDLQGVPTTTNFVFTVTLSAASSQDVTVDFTTADGTADNTDYAAVRGTLTFKAGETSKTITVAVVGDGIFEPDEQFFVNLSNPVNADLVDAQAIGTILNDDPG